MRFNYENKSNSWVCESHNPGITIAQVSGDGIVHQLLMVLIVGICVAIVWALGRWFVTKFAAPPIVMTVWNGLFLLLGAIFIINFLMGLAGHPLIRW